MHEVWLVAILSYKEAIRNRWLLSFSLGFAFLTFLLSFIGSSDLETFSQFNKLSAMLVNVLMLFIPLMGFALGAQLISGDREEGVLVYLLSHPLTKVHYFAGRFLGSFLALATSLSLGFAISSGVIGFWGVHMARSFLVLWGLALLFTVMCMATGMMISVFSNNRAHATGAAIFLWLFLTVIGDLGLMGTAYLLRLRSEAIVALSLFNPVEVFKILVIRLLATDLEVLGAAGMYLDRMIGQSLPLYLIGWLSLMTLVLSLVGCWIFTQQEEW
ncbi:MAG: ABC transporter permease subunit [Deltaproteobacteria bacterium]|nr:ABC transporter permease subunit [Deltaproteobacteria bacterium]